MPVPHPDNDATRRPPRVPVRYPVWRKTCLWLFSLAGALGCIVALANSLAPSPGPPRPADRRDSRRDWPDALLLDCLACAPGADAAAPRHTAAAEPDHGGQAPSAATA
jgi:hypothetical protein